jgi:hypothetical protein
MLSSNTYATFVVGFAIMTVSFKQWIGELAVLILSF